MHRAAIKPSRIPFAGRRKVIFSSYYDTMFRFFVLKIRRCLSAVNHSAQIRQSYKKLLFFLCKKPPRLPVTETGAVRLLYLCFFKRSRNYLRGFLIAAWAGAKITERSESHISTYNRFYNFASSYIVVSFQPHCYSIKTRIHCSLIYIALIKHIPNVPFNRLI